MCRHPDEGAEMNGERAKELAQWFVYMRPEFYRKYWGTVIYVPTFKWLRRKR